MASLNQAWNIATGALAADQAAISVVAGNIANANTPGYTTESVTVGIRRYGDGQRPVRWHRRHP